MNTTKAEQIVDRWINSLPSTKISIHHREVLITLLIQYSTDQNKQLVGLLKRVKPATLDRNFRSASLEALCADIEAALLAQHSEKV